MMRFEVIHGEALEELAKLPDASIDACITDPPYGTTACAWDSVIPFAPMWEQLKRVVKPRGAIVLFASQPFTSALVMSSPKMFKYEWVWNKSHASGFLYARQRPMQKHENICVFGQDVIAYNPQMERGVLKPTRSGEVESERKNDSVYGRTPKNLEVVWTDTYYPTTSVNFSSGARCESLHPTQKPVALMRYLVRTYTNEGGTVLDFTCGSGTTGEACVVEKRNCILIDSDAYYCEVSRARLTRASGKYAEMPARRNVKDRETPLLDLLTA